MLLPWKEILRIVAFALHAIGAIVATVFCFLCDAQTSRQLATTPIRLPLPPAGWIGGNISNVRAQRVAFPWAEDNPQTYNAWNPFILVAVFEWLTAGFALRNLSPWVPHTHYAFRAWMAAGSIVVVSWGIAASSATWILLLFLMLVSFAVCIWFSMPAFRQQWMLKLQTQCQATPLVTSMLDGRIWLIPQKIIGLKLASPDSDTDPLLPDEGRLDDEYINGVLDRYMEYCVTAPILFVAVACLLVTDAPAWMFVIGYMFLIACNLFGISIHCNAIQAYQEARAKKTDGDQSTADMSWTGYVFDLIYTGTWRSKRVKQLYLLEAAWLCLAVPMGGLIYLTRGYLFSPDLPSLAAFMIWQLFVTYSLFGIIPTAIYLSGRGYQQLDLILDVLNLSAKFPIPMIILAGYIMRPAGLNPCFS